MDYVKIHDKFIEYFKNTNHMDRMKKRNPNDFRLNEKYVYCENHHILPITLGGSDDPPNLVKLLPEEHLFIHMLRYKAFNNRVDFLAVRYTLNGINNKKLASDAKISINKKLRSAVSFIKQNKSKFRIKHGWQTEEGKQRISEQRKNTVPVKDKITGESIGSVSVNHPKVLNGEWVHTSTGRKVSQKERKLRSIRGMGELNNNFKYTLKYLTLKVQEYLDVIKPKYFNGNTICAYYRNKSCEFPKSLETNIMQNILKGLVLNNSVYNSRIDNKELGDYSVLLDNECKLFYMRKDALDYCMKELKLSEDKSSKIIRKTFNFDYAIYRYNELLETFTTLNEFIKYCEENNYPFHALDSTIQGMGMLGQSNISKVKLDKKGYVNYEGLHAKKIKRKIND